MKNKIIFTVFSFSKIQSIYHVSILKKKKKELNTFKFHSHILLLTKCLNSTLPYFGKKKKTPTIKLLL